MWSETYNERHKTFTLRFKKPQKIIILYFYQIRSHVIKHYDILLDKTKNSIALIPMIRDCEIFILQMYYIKTEHNFL